MIKTQPNQFIQQTSIGLMRKVNPWRNQSYTANVTTKSGTISARTNISSRPDLNQWDIYFIFKGIEYYYGDPIDGEKIRNWANEKIANTEVGGWITRSPEIPLHILSLPAKHRPKTQDLQTVANLALSIDPNIHYPHLDFYELWLCDKETKEPIAIALTDSTLAGIDAVYYHPKFRFDRSIKDFYPKLKLLESEINSRINASDCEHTWAWTHRIFKRIPGQPIIEYRGHGDDGLPIEFKEYTSELPNEWLENSLFTRYIEIIN